MSNVISITERVKRDRNEQDRKQLRQTIYTKAVDVERRCRRIKEHANYEDRDAFLWSNITMLYQDLGEMNEQIESLIGDVDFEEEGLDDWDCEGQDRIE